MANLQHMTMADYLASDGISKHQLDDLHRSPAHYQHRLLNPSEPTAAMLVGSMLNTAVLEPHLFDDQFYALPAGIDGRTKEGKAIKAELELANIGKRAVKEDDLKTVIAMRDAVFANSRAAAALGEGGIAEASMFWQCPGFDCISRGRPDYICNGLIVDLKKTQDARADAFSRQVWNLRYHVQAAYYIDGYKALFGEELRFVFVAVEEPAPHGVAVYLTGEGMLDQARREYRQDLAVYCECLQSGVWPCYPEMVQALTLPTWAQDRGGF